MSKAADDVRVVNLKEATEGFVDNHLDSLSLLRKHIWRTGERRDEREGERV